MNEYTHECFECKRTIPLKFHRCTICYSRTIKQLDRIERRKARDKQKALERRFSQLIHVTEPDEIEGIE